MTAPACLLAAPVLLAAAMLVAACAAPPRPRAELPAEVQTGAVVPTEEATAEPLPAGIVPLAKEQDERLSQ